MNAFVPGTPTDIWPACFPDSNGQVYLRGHVSLSPVPAVGGSVLGLFPKDAQGNCSCTPHPDPGLQDNTVIATTTALAYPNSSDTNMPDVCIVRLLISQRLPPDVNGDFVVNQMDIDLIKENNPLYSIDASAPSKCPISKGRRVCGPTDVNMDGLVNELDANSVIQSLALGTPLPCGGVYATAFSCGSSRRQPLTPAVDISLDSIVWFNDDGLDGKTTPSKREVRAAHDDSLIHSMLVEFEDMQTEIAILKDHVGAEMGQMKSQLGIHGAKLGAHDDSLKFVTARVGTNVVRFKDTLLEVGISAAIIVLAAALLFMWKRMSKH